jgi:hypothetical protein
VNNETKEMPANITKNDTIRVIIFLGTMSPYPTVVIVTTAHQIALKNDPNVFGSNIVTIVAPIVALTKIPIIIKK